MAKLRPKYLSAVTITREEAIAFIGRRFPVLSFEGLLSATNQQLVEHYQQITRERQSSRMGVSGLKNWNQAHLDRLTKAGRP